MDLLNLYETLTLEDIDEFISSKREENLNLEFKTISDAKFSNKNDKRNLARALSGFSNSNGGLVIWGVEARRNQQGVDCANGIRAITNVNLFLSRLNEFTGMAASPIVDGVQHRSIEIESGTGIIITYIPESQFGPHMAKMGEDRYYKRSGDSFYRLEHFDLEDMFGRRPKPVLIFHSRIIGTSYQVKIHVGIQNIGKGVAKAPYLAFNMSKPFKFNIHGLDGNRNEGMKRLPFIASLDLPYRYGAGDNLVIHSGVTHEIASIHLGIYSTESPPILETDLTIHYEMAAEGVRLIRGEKVIALHELGFST